MSPLRLAPLSLTFLAASLAACGSMSGRSSMPMAAPFSQEALPDTVKVPAGHRVAWETVGVGEITYECRAKAGAADAFEWVFVGPKADLRSRQGQVVGVAMLVDRSNGAVDLGVPTISLIKLNVETFDPNQLPPDLAAIPAVKPGSR